MTVRKEYREEQQPRVIDVAQDRDRWQAVLKMVMKLWVP
jgi:hypothetical protein